MVEVGGELGFSWRLYGILNTSQGSIDLVGHFKSLMRQVGFYIYFTGVKSKSWRAAESTGFCSLLPAGWRLKI